MKNVPTILMIRPVNFSFNAQTAVNNSFQTDPTKSNSEDAALIQEQALDEFDQFVSVLTKFNVPIRVIEDTEQPVTPDSIFPNNWFSTHDQRAVVLYPMFAENRRLERKPSVKNMLEKNYEIKIWYDLSPFEKRAKFLEGTGSMVLDRLNKVAYACDSPRTDEDLFSDFCSMFKYTPIWFHAYDRAGEPIYHTNVLMCVGADFVVINLEAIPSEEQAMVKKAIAQSNKKIIPISHSQMEQFAGNMLQVKNQQGEQLVVMSTQAFQSLTEEQIELLSEKNTIVHTPLYTIEKYGGGSARCMMAEIYLNERKDT